MANKGRIVYKVDYKRFCLELKIGFIVFLGSVLSYQQLRPPVLRKIRSNPKSQYIKPEKTLLIRYKVALIDKPIHKKCELIAHNLFIRIT